MCTLCILKNKCIIKGIQKTIQTKIREIRCKFSNLSISSHEDKTHLPSKKNTFFCSNKITWALTVFKKLKKKNFINLFRECHVLISDFLPIGEGGGFYNHSTQRKILLFQYWRIDNLETSGMGRQIWIYHWQFCFKIIAF